MPDAALLDEIRAALETERDNLSRQLASLGAGKTGTDLDHNFADSGAVAAEVGEARSLAGSLEDQLASVEAALSRMDAGTYGRCQACGEAIADARLEAIPAAKFCINCAAARRS